METDSTYTPEVEENTGRLERALIEGTVHGICLEREGLHLLHRFFADDVNLIMEARLPNLLNCQEIYHRFGCASGLFCDWDKSKAVLVSNQPLPTELAHLNWSWENDLTATKLLGFFIGADLAVTLMETQLDSILAARLSKLRNLPATLMARVTLINSILLGSIWFIVTLWAGDDSKLRALEKQILTYLWSGGDETARHRVDASTIYLSRAKGGLGIINIRAQTEALLGKFVLWAVSEGTHPLQIILRTQFRDLSLRRWGSADLTWVFNRCRTLPIQASNVFTNICRSWNKAKCDIVHRSPANLAEFLRLPVWTPSWAHIDQKCIKGTSIAARRLREAGIKSVFDIRHSAGRALTWDEQGARGLPIAARNSYFNACSNIDLCCPSFGADSTLVKFTVGPLFPSINDTMWTAISTTEKRKTTWSPGTIRRLVARFLLLSKDTIQGKKRIQDGNISKFLVGE